MKRRLMGALFLTSCKEWPAALVVRSVVENMDLNLTTTAYYAILIVENEFCNKTIGQTVELFIEHETGTPRNQLCSNDNILGN